MDSSKLHSYMEAKNKIMPQAEFACANATAQISAKRLKRVLKARFFQYFRIPFLLNEINEGKTKDHIMLQLYKALRQYACMIGFVLIECPFSDEALTDVSVSPRPLVLHLKRDILSGLNESFHSNSELPNLKIYIFNHICWSKSIKNYQDVIIYQDVIFL